MTTRSYARGQQAEPHQPRSRLRATVEFLRLVTFRYLRGNANENELRRACEEVLAALTPLGPAMERQPTQYELGVRHGREAHEQGQTLEEAMGCGIFATPYLKGVYAGFGAAHRERLVPNALPRPDHEGP